MSKIGDLVIQMQEDAYTYDVGTFVDMYGDTESSREFYRIHSSVIDTPSGPYEDPENHDQEFVLSNN